VTTSFTATDEGQLSLLSTNTSHTVTVSPGSSVDLLWCARACHEL